MDAGPIGERRTGNNDRAEQFGANGSKHHDCPSRLAISDHAGLAARVGMRSGHLLDEHRFRAGDVLDGLARNWIRREADEIARMPSLHCDADFAVGLEPADARTVPGTRIHDNERPKLRIDRHACGRDDAHEAVVDRAVELAPVDDELDFVIEHMRSGFRQMFAVLISALTHHVPKQDGALGGVGHVLHRRREHAKWRCCGSRCGRLLFVLVDIAALPK